MHLLAICKHPTRACSRHARAQETLAKNRAAKDELYKTRKELQALQRAFDDAVRAPVQCVYVCCCLSVRQGRV